MDNTAPVFTASYPKAGAAQAIDSRKVEFLVEANEAGTAYYVVVANGATPPNVAQIMAGKDSKDATPFNSGNASITANIEKSFITAALPEHDKGYDVYIVVKDIAGNLTIRQIDVKTPQAKAVTNIAIKTQPTNVSYIEGQKLNLTGLVVTLFYNDNTNKDVALTQFSANKITTDPTNGTELKVADNHGKPVAVTCNSETANTDSLFVAPAASIVSTSPTTFTEAAANDGSLVSQDIVVTITNGTLALDIAKVNVTVANLPNGLNFTINRDCDTQLTISINDNATNHANANDVNNLAFTIAQAKVTGATSNLTTSNISINFNDSASIGSTNPTTLTEAEANDGSLASGDILVTITNGTLASDIAKGDVTATNLPGNLDYTVTRNSDTQLTISINDNATNHANANDVNNLTFTIAQAKVTGATNNLTIDNISIDFND